MQNKLNIHPFAANFLSYSSAKSYEHRLTNNKDTRKDKVGTFVGHSGRLNFLTEPFAEPFVELKFSLSTELSQKVK